MGKEVIGKKLGMTQIFKESGEKIAVTVVEVEPMVVVQKKISEKDGYNAVQVATIATKQTRLNKPQLGHLAKSKCEPKKVLKEIEVEEFEKVEVGSVLNCNVFKAGDVVSVCGRTKGRGFTGTIKRWNAGRLKMTHGTGPVHRERGSSGAHSDPSRVFKGLKMAGRYGNEQVTIKNLKIVKVDVARNVILISGAVPGNRGSLLTIKSSKA